jgi:hypothetical protein
VSASDLHPATSSRRPAAHGGSDAASYAPVSFHSAMPRAALICTDDLGAASYISPPP